MALELFQSSLLRKLEEQLKETQVAKDELVAQQQELHEMMIRFANLLLFVFHEVILWNTRQVFNEMSKGIDPSPNPQTGGEQDHGGRGKSEVGRGDQLQTIRGEIF